MMSEGDFSGLFEPHSQLVPERIGICQNFSTSDIRQFPLLFELAGTTDDISFYKYYETTFEIVSGKRRFRQL
jgi:hypothetical protein